jgi:hypothetical protein
MAKSAAIGNLFVNLGLNSAEFTAGMKAAQTGMAKFSKATSIGFAAVTAAAAAAAGGLAFAVKGAIDHADELGKTAQKIGLSVEALSRLEYAAKLSDVSLEGLSTGLRKFSQEIVAGSKAFGALGIAVRDSSGNLRATDALLYDVADRFGRMEDGAAKTALAVQLFGRAGADLIPLLNGGAEGLARMADASDRAGSTISTSTARAAEQFNDTITAVNLSLGGVVNQIMEAALPALQSLADTIASPEFAQAAQTLAVWLVESFNAITQAVVATTNAIAAFSHDAKPGAGAPLSNALLPGEKLNLADSIRSASTRANSAYPIPASSLYAGFGFGADGKMNVQEKTAPFVPMMEGAKAATASVTDLMAGLDQAQPKVESFAQTVGQTMADAFAGFADAVLSGVNPLKALGDELGNIGKQLVSSAISSFFGNLFGGGFGGKPGFVGTGFGAYGMYAAGGIATSPSIFGEAGPEAAVPLPDGRTIPVTLSGNVGGGGEVLIRLDQGLVAQVLRQADQNAVKIVDSRAPAAVARTQRNGGL